MYAHKRVLVLLVMSGRTGMYVHVCVCVCMHVCMYACMAACMYVQCTCIVRLVHVMYVMYVVC